MSSVLQAQIADDCDRYDEDRRNEEALLPQFSSFDLPFPSLSPDFGGEIEYSETIVGSLENILSHEINDEELKNKIACRRVPPLLSILR